MNKTVKWSVIATAVIAVGVGIYLAQPPALTEASPISFEILDKDKNVVGQYIVPDDTAITQEPNAQEILYGKRLMNETKRLLPEHVGASMNCSSCHVAQGKINMGAPYFTTSNSYPRIMPRAGTEVDLTGRINGCFQRSMNGKPLDPDSREMKAMIAYIDWVGQKVPKDQKVQIQNAGKINEDLVPDPMRGKVLYAAQCASCHGDNGEGLKDSRGDIVFPPLWGDDSFNIGAGMARTYKAAAFIKYNMPMGVQQHGAWGQGGVLSDQEAVDIAEYFTHMPRPDFAGKVNDWAKGNKPKDARY